MTDSLEHDCLVRVLVLTKSSNTNNVYVCSLYFLPLHYKTEVHHSECFGIFKDHVPVSAYKYTSEGIGGLSLLFLDLTNKLQIQIFLPYRPTIYLNKFFQKILWFMVQRQRTLNCTPALNYNCEMVVQESAAS